MQAAMTAKAKAGYVLVGVCVGVLLTVLFLLPTLKETSREQKYGLLLSPEDVKGTCGQPQADDIYKLTYFDGDRRVELQFMGMNHRMFLTKVNWVYSKGFPVGEIRQVSRAQISDEVKHGWLPSCLEDAAWP